MFNYNQSEDILRYKGKEVKKSDKRTIALFIISEIAQGKALTHIPLESDVFPPLYEILNYIDGKADLVEELIKAEKSRLDNIREKLIEATMTYQKNPCQENKDITEALSKTYNILSKQQQNSGALVVNFHKVFPDDFWEREIDWSQKLDDSV